MLGQEALTHKYKLKHQTFKAILPLSSDQQFFPSLCIENMQQYAKRYGEDSSFLPIIQISQIDLAWWRIFYSELRLIFVYLESDSWYLTAWVSPRLFLGQAWVYLPHIVCQVRRRR